MSKTLSIIAIVVVVIGAGIVAKRLFFTDSFDLPAGNGNTETTTILIEDGKIVDVENDQIVGDNNNVPRQVVEKEIMITDGVKHTIPLSEILSGCPSKDCIPSIDNPVFESVNDATDWLDPDDIGISLSIDGIERFYPYRILVSHEIVNDTINGKRVLVTYCPLCFTGIVFDPLVAGKRVEFGVSGKLWNSNLLMYDRETETLWSQVTAEAVLGEQTGAQLDIISSDITKFGLWSTKHPNGESLSRDTGRAFSSYEFIPYGGDLTDIKPFFPLSSRDSRLPETAFVLGIVIDGQAKAYHFDAVKLAGKIEDSFAGRLIVAEYKAETDAVRIFEKKDDGTLERLTSIPVFWFSWAATYPETELLK